MDPFDLSLEASFTEGFVAAGIDGSCASFMLGVLAGALLFLLEGISGWIGTR